MRVLKLFLIVTLAATLAACAGIKDRSDNPINTLPVAKLYQTAHAEVAHGKYSQAATAFQRLIERFPFGEYNQQAQIELAYAQYKDRKPDAAYATINRFIKTYPTQKHIAYAYYLRGLINFERAGHFAQRILGVNDRSRHDQGYRLESFDDFARLVRRYPNSKYAADARQRMIYLRNGLAQFEINIAEQYLRDRAYIAAAHRAKYVIQHYQEAPQTGDALAILTRCYLALHLPKLAAQSREVLKLNYPHHPYLTDPKWPHSASTLRRMIPFSGHH